MAKRKITANEVLNDLREGLDDFALMKKYQLSAQGLQSLFNKMINSGAITPTELEDRITPLEKTVELGLFFCSACGNTESNEFTTCPRCGFTPPGNIRKAPTPTGQDKRSPSPGPDARKSPGVPKAPKPAADLRTQADTLSMGLRAGLQTSGPACSVEDELPHLERLSWYSQVLSVGAMVAYALAVMALTALVWLLKPGESISVMHWFLGVLVLAIPSSVVAFVVVVSLRALALSMKMLQGMVAASSRNNRSSRA
ncbi:MAG: hypothetical protein AB1646_03190 [Thermodesulfobacteriota bacterium]